MTQEKEAKWPVGQGWWSLLDKIVQVVEERKKQVPELEFRFLQVKEKFGSLRIYVYCGDEEVQRAVSDAELASESVCENCGAPGRMCGEYWMKVLCETCEKTKK